MTRPLKLVLVVGARPNFMKVAPLIKCIEAHNTRLDRASARIEWRLVHTGQHYDERMSKVFFQELGIPEPAVNLAVGSGSHAAQTAHVMLRFEPVLLAERPDWVVVFGDVNSTLACTLVAAKLGVKVAHVEAGLRSFDRSMPEEINRVLTDAISDLLLTPSEDANENLRREGIREDRIRLVGNIMIDSLILYLPAAERSRILDALHLRGKDFIYVTLHRPANVDHPDVLTAIVTELKRLAQQIPIVFPMHPRTVQKLKDLNISLNGASGVKIIEPVGYHDSLRLAKSARLVLTDSGGLQEETTFFRTPCLTLRPNTERPVTITQGSNRLTSVANLAQDLEAAMQAATRRGSVPAFWDGQAAPRIIHALMNT
jgi:UDP-N-acetylglucosamine 2-epimerase (non-hydrolysing)